MMALVIGSTLALLSAIDTGRRRWWVVYALCSAGAMYSHYTCAFLLAAQAVWALATQPAARRAVLLANAGAAVLFAPWVTGLLADFDSPTTKILDKLAPFTAHNVRPGHRALVGRLPGLRLPVARPVPERDRRRRARRRAGARRSRGAAGDADAAGGARDPPRGGRAGGGDPRQRRRHQPDRDAQPHRVVAGAHPRLRRAGLRGAAPAADPRDRPRGPRASRSAR